MILEYRKLLILSTLVTVSYVMAVTISPPPSLNGLSTVLGTTINQTSSSRLATSTLQLYTSLVLIALLIFLELTDPSYGKTPSFLVELRTGWLPEVVLLLILFSLIVVFKVFTILLMV